MATVTTLTTNESGSSSLIDINANFLAINTELISDTSLKAPLASPTFTGTVIIPVPFTLGATPVTATGVEYNYLVGVTSAIQTQLNLKSPLASPTFTGAVTHPTPFTLGAISVTTTGTQLNYFNAATGTTGTPSTNVVFSTSPTLVTPTLGVATGTRIGLGQAADSSAVMAATGQYFSTAYTLTDAATIALNWDNGNVQKVTLGGNRTFTFTNSKAGGRYIIELIQDATGSRTITWPTIKWQGGSAPTLTTTASKTDLITLIWDGTSYFGASSLNY